MTCTTDAALSTGAGREVSFVTTMSFTTQLVALYLLALSVALLRNRMTPQAVSRIVNYSARSLLK